MQTSPMSYGSPSKKNTFYLPRFGFLEYHLSPPMAHLRLQSLSLFITDTNLPTFHCHSLSPTNQLSLSLTNHLSLLSLLYSLSFIFSPLSPTNHLSLTDLSVSFISHFIFCCIFSSIGNLVPFNYVCL